MAITPEGISVAVILILHVTLLIWAARKIFRSKLSGFEKSSWFLLCLILPLVGAGVYATYEKKYLLKRELLHLTLAVILLGFLFSFRLWGVDVFDVGMGTNNWLRMCGLALIALGVHTLAQKAIARKYQSMSRFGLWPLGIAISIILIFLTNGWFVWAAIGCAAVSSKYFLRPGRRGIHEALGPFEIGKIMAAGTFASIGLAVLGKLLIPTLGKLAQQFMVMNLWIAVFSAVPLFLGRMSLTLGTARIWNKLFPGKKRHLTAFPTKPHLRHRTGIVLPLTMRRIGEQWRSEGELLLFGSRPLWIFTFIFAVVITIMLLFFGAIASVLTAAVAASILLIIWAWKLEPFRWGGSG